MRLISPYTHGIQELLITMRPNQPPFQIRLPLFTTYIAKFIWDNTVKFVREIIKFVWDNIPTLRELILYSAIQSAVEITTNTDKRFGNNPVEKAFIRDSAKVPGELLLSLQRSPYGQTSFWHDEFSLISVVQKPLVKAFIIHQSHLTNTHTSIDQFEQLINKNNDNKINFTIPDNLKCPLETYSLKGNLGKASRLSNFVGEPISRIIDGTSKLYQQNINTPNPVNFIQFIKNIPATIKYIGIHGPKKIPYALSNSAVKIGALDFIGNLYGGLGIKEYFTKWKEYATEKALSVLDKNQVNIKKLLFWDIISLISEQEDISFVQKTVSISTVFSLELVEKTLYNMLTMAILSTPSKVIGNILYFSDEHYPKLSAVVGVAAGAFYVQNEFIGSQVTNHSFTDFTKKSKVTTTPSDQGNCYISFFDQVLADNNGKLPDTKKNIREEYFQNLRKCLEQTVVPIPTETEATEYTSITECDSELEESPLLSPMQNEISYD